MFKNVYRFVIILHLLTGCNSDDDRLHVNLPPSSFEISVDNITDRSATITWTPAIDPEGRTVNYRVIINEEIIFQTADTRSYSFTGLDAESNYNGEIIASNGVNSSTAGFEFTTQEFTPKIYNGYVRLTNQAEVNDFGDQGFNIINGSLGIESLYGPRTNITDLSPLRDLQEVKDYLRIRDSSLETLQGLNNLEKIGGYLGITYNSKLMGLEGLEKLHTIVGYLGMHSNPEIVDLGPLETTESIREIHIGYNEKLKHIRLLPNALSVDHIYIYDSPSLEAIEGFDKVQYIKYDIEIIGNQKLRTIPKFEDLISVNYGFYINNNKQLEKIDFPKLERITYGLEIINNPILTEITGFNKLLYVGNQFYIWNNFELSYFCNLLPLVTNGVTSEYFVISGNAYNPSYEEIKAGNCEPG